MTSPNSADYDAGIRDAVAAIEEQREQFRRVTGTPKGDVLDLVYNDAARTVEMLLTRHTTPGGSHA